MDIFGGHNKIGISLGVISMYFRAIPKVYVQNGDISWVAKCSNIFGVLDISDIFWGKP